MTKQEIKKAYDDQEHVFVQRARYGNHVGRGVVIDPDYRGFPGKEGALVEYHAQWRGVGFVHFHDIHRIKLGWGERPPTGRVKRKPAPSSNGRSLAQHVVPGRAVMGTTFSFDAETLRRMQPVFLGGVSTLHSTPPSPPRRSSRTPRTDPFDTL